MEEGREDAVLAVGGSDKQLVDRHRRPRKRRSGERVESMRVECRAHRHAHRLSRPLRHEVRRRGDQVPQLQHQSHSRRVVAGARAQEATVIVTRVREDEHESNVRHQLQLFDLHVDDRCALPLELCDRLERRAAYLVVHEIREVVVALDADPHAVDAAAELREVLGRQMKRRGSAAS